MTTGNSFAMVSYNESIGDDTGPAKGHKRRQKAYSF
jgi:hypothetical protein